MRCIECDRVVYHPVGKTKETQTCGRCRKITVTPRKHVTKAGRRKPSSGDVMGLQPDRIIYSTQMGGGQPPRGNALDKQILKLQTRLYYINHREELIGRRRNYRRQPWPERMDNPRNCRRYHSFRCSKEGSYC